ncbi:hypothetical protein TWF696_009297 [Orbilia brochopaga]|uniref:A to I editase domain-containing protein n=1 Tax=Orbilia brochopaga TaxID=3140254 RepID=A0AAV9UET1_9PEZI
MAGKNLCEQVAQLAFDTFESLPARCKPRTDQSGIKEWVPMSAVILAQNNISPPVLQLAALATGSKCLPATTLPKAHGLILHDSHSEILALRGLNHFLLQETYHLLKDPEYISPYLIRTRDTQVQSIDKRPYAFQIRPSITIHLFSTEAPCGDASMEFIMSAQQDATPWPIPIPPPTNNSPEDEGNSMPSLPGRSYFSALSIVRRKPSRPDASPTLSKSCTDKLTLKQFTSTLSSLPALLISPRNAYISTFTIPADKYNPESYNRAFGTTGRLSALATAGVYIDDPRESYPAEYTFTPFVITPLPATFDYTYRYSKPPPTDTTTKASKTSTLYINCRNASDRTTEVLVSGVKQGHAQFSTDHRKGSAASRKKTWRLLREIAELLDDDDEELKTRVAVPCYADVKAACVERAAVKQRVVEALGGWHKNCGDDEWGFP